jgi:hypothetical protein
LPINFEISYDMWWKALHKNEEGYLAAPLSRE